MTQKLTQNLKKTNMLTKMMVGIALLVSGCTIADDAPSSSSAVSTQAVQTHTVSYKQGQVLSIIAPIPDKKGSAALEEYYAGVFPLARSFGFKRDIQFSINDTLVGKFKPAALIFFSWPDAAAETSLYGHEDWPKLKALRPQAWKELRIYSKTLEDDLDLTFSSDKFYTVAAAWIDPEHPDDYERYLSGIKTTVNELGGRFIYKMNVQRFENLGADLSLPVQLTFVEWDSEEGSENLQASDVFKANLKYFSSGLKGFELHRISVLPPNNS
jgi:uncharacterized protein (DUF1330 family)